jgi:hypothetical protein
MLKEARLMMRTTPSLIRSEWRRAESGIHRRNHRRARGPRRSHGRAPRTRCRIARGPRRARAPSGDDPPRPSDIAPSERAR